MHSFFHLPTALPLPSTVMLQKATPLHNQSRLQWAVSTVLMLQTAEVAKLEAERAAEEPVCSSPPHSG